ncbi:MAG: hypothetical protein ACHRXM_07450 [Isosphaerales bacterium]
MLAPGGDTTESSVMAISQVPKEILAAWLRSEKARRAPAQSLAVALECVLEKDEKSYLSAKETEELAERLVLCPGHPRIVYLFYARTNDSKYLAVLRSEISEDQSPGLKRDLEIAVVILRNKSFILEHLNAIKAGLSRSRLALLEEVLKREPGKRKRSARP